MTPVVSIIIPHYERPELLRQTVDSVRQQEFSDWELIIVDDGSCSETWREIQGLVEPRIRVTQRTQGPKGPSQCRNLGAAKASGEYVMFLDSDDLLARDCLEQRVRKALQQPDFDLWVFPVELFRERPGDLQQPWNHMSDASEVLERFLRSDGPWCVSSGLWRRSEFQRVGGFNPLVMYGDDADLHIRALLLDSRFLQCIGTPADVFIRRSDVARITNGCDEAMLKSRRVRLMEGQRALRTLGASQQQQQIWQGQYFAEGEFLLFTQQEPSKELQEVKRRWEEDYPGFSVRRGLAWAYLWLAVLFRSRCYLAVRVMRRMLMVVLPESWFPSRRTQQERASA
jgi:glycosyltransferase involved in cell wall biosynthesis